MSGPILAELNRLKRLEDAKRKETTEKSLADQCRVQLSDLPFDPSVGAEQLAHAKQRIRDLRQDIALLEANAVVMRDAMTRRQDIIDYVKHIVLHDSFMLSLFQDDTQRAEYQRMFVSVLDGSELHGMNAVLERQLLGDQLLKLHDRVRVLDARDATKTRTLREKDQRVATLTAERDELVLQLSKSKMQHTTLYQVLQDVKVDLNESKDHALQSKREADMLRKTLDGTLAELKAKEAAFSATQARCKHLEEQMSALSSQSESEKRLAAEALQSVAAMSLDAGRLSELVVSLPRGSPPWVSNVQQVSDICDKIKTSLSASGPGLATDIASSLLKGLGNSISVIKAMNLALQEVKDQNEKQWAELQLSVELRQVQQSTVSAGIARCDKLQLVKGLQDTIVQVNTALSSSALSHRGCEGLYSASLHSIVSIVELCTQALRTNEGIVTSLQEQISALQSASKEVAPTVQGLPFDESMVAQIVKLIQKLRSDQDSHAQKLFPSTKPKGWEEMFGSYLESMTESLQEYRQLDSRSAVPSTVVAQLMDALSADLGILKSARRDVQRGSETLKSLQCEISELKEKENAKHVPDNVPVPAPRDTAVPRMLTEVSSALDGIRSNQKKSMTDACDASNYASLRQQISVSIEEVNDVCQNTTVVDEEDRAVHKVLTQALSCLFTENEEASALFNTLASLDDPAVIRCLTDGKLSEGDGRGKFAIRALAAHLQRIKAGRRPLLSTTATQEKSKPTSMEPPPQVTKAAVLQAATQTANADQDTVKKTKPALTIDEAIRLVKDAGKWPSKTVVPKTVAVDEGTQAAVPSSIRSTQTKADAVKAVTERGTMTEAYLLQQYLGLASDGRVNSTSTPASRTQRTSIVQFFSADGDLEHVNAVSTKEASALLGGRTASSIPSKRMSVDVDLIGKSFSSFSRKHSIAALMSRRPSVSISREDNDSDSSVVLASESFGNFQPEVDVPFTTEMPRPVARTVFGIQVEEQAGDAKGKIDPEAQFYAALGNVRPMSALSRPQQLPGESQAVSLKSRPSSALQRRGSLRERNKEISAYCEAVQIGHGTRRASESSIKRQQIMDVVKGSNGTPPPGVKELAAPRRQSIRQLSSDSATVSDPCQKGWDETPSL